jgi:hypothetical protein
MPSKHIRTLPESEALSSVVFFAECLLSDTRQKRLCRVPHSVKLGSRQRAPLPSAEHSVQGGTRQRQVCRVSNTRQSGSRQRAVSGRPRADGRQSLPRANGWHSAKRLLCRVPHSRHSAKHSLSSVISRHSTKYIFIFFNFVSQTFCGMFLHYVDLHVSFVDNYNIVSIVSRFSSFI